MKDDIAIHVLEINFLEFLTGFLEGRVQLTVILQTNERIYSRDHTLLSESLITVSSSLHQLKLRIDKGETLGSDSIINIVNDNMLVLIEGQKERR